MSLPQPIIQEARERRFDLKKPDVQRYFVAQAVAEVLTAGLFYQSVRPVFRQMRPLLSGLDIDKGVLLRREVERNFRDATLATGDYETIFSFSRGALWVLGVEARDVTARWTDLFDAVNGIRLDQVDSEILGVIFERLIAPERRREMGQHYTQTRLARAMVAWAARDESDTVVDLSSGGGTFLVEAYNRLKESGRSHEDILRLVYGNDLDSFAVHLSTVNLAARDIHRGRNVPAVSNMDAFRLRPGSTAVEVAPAKGEPYRLVWPHEFDAIVGNPPYDLKAPDPALCREALASIHPESRPPIPPGNLDAINLAAWFLLLAAAWLAPSGRIALVLPASILQNQKHAPLLRWLRANYDVAVWHTDADVWFSDARVAPIALFAVPRGAAGGLGRFWFTSLFKEVDGGVVEIDELPVPPGRSETRDLTALDPACDALLAGTVPKVLEEFEQLPRAVPISAMERATVYRGNKLGHPFFKLEDQEPARPAAVRLVVGNHVQTRLHMRYLVPLLKSAKDVPTGEFEPSGTKWWILAAPAKLPSGGKLQEYIRIGTRSGVPAAPSVAQRGDTWWAVEWKTAHIAINAHPQFRHQVWWSDTPFVATDNLQAIAFTETPKADQEVIAASLASAFGALAALHRSNEVGCEGVRWVSTRNLEGWSVLDAARLDDDAKAEVTMAYRTYRELKSAKLYQMSKRSLEAWTELTAAVARAAGAPNPHDLARQAVNAAVETTRRRREREIRATSGRTGAGRRGGNRLTRQVQEATRRHRLYPRAIAALTEGGETARLKNREVRTALFDLGDETMRAEEENALVAVLGEGFSAAPSLEAGSAELVRTLVAEATSAWIPTDEAGLPLHGYEDMAASLREAVVATILRGVKAALS
jgi:hypothetical protein